MRTSRPASKSAAKSQPKSLEARLWAAADNLRANSPLRLNEFSEPVLGLIFLKFADVKFAATKQEIEGELAATTSHGRERSATTDHYRAKGVLFVPEEARYGRLLDLPESADLGKALNEAMKAVERENRDLSGVLPKSYHLLDNHSLVVLLRNFNQIPADIEGDAFGRIYEYFLGNFALSDGRGGGEFFTPTSIVKLIVEILEPYHGRIYDPACGSGGMFVQSSEFVARRHKGNRAKAGRDLAVFGQEKTEQSVRIGKMNLAVHGLSGDIRQGNTYYEDLHKSFGRFDFTMANPPFNVGGVDWARLKGDRRFPYGLPRCDNGNYLWIQIFLSSLADRGRAGFVMANSASDAGHSELEIRRQIIEAGFVDVMVAVGPNMFLNVTLPVTLWFLDKGKPSARRDKVLFIDARSIYRVVDKAHRDWTDEQIDQIAGIVRSYRGEEGAAKYKDVKGLCKAATLKEIAAAGYSLNPGRYVGVAEGKAVSGEEYKEKMVRLRAEFKRLTAEAHGLEKKIVGDWEEL